MVRIRRIQMLFNSHIFIFCFLPFVWIVFYTLKALGSKRDSLLSLNLAKVFLVCASLFFYAYWKLMYLPILLGSIVCNYLIAQAILGKSFVLRQKQGARLQEYRQSQEHASQTKSPKSLNPQEYRQSQILTDSQKDIKLHMGGGILQNLSCCRYCL